jgi:16S rRNA processing protein RimM
MGEDRLIPMGVITAPHGIKGEVRIRSFTADPGDLTAYGALCDKHGVIYDVVIKSFTKDVVIATITGITSRDDAEKLRNVELCVPRSALPDGDENEYYHEDLIGLTLSTEDGTPYGTLAAVHNFGAGDLVAIKRATGEEEFVPFTRATFPSIDLQKHTGIIVPPVLIAGE